MQFHHYNEYYIQLYNNCTVVERGKRQASKVEKIEESECGVYGDV